MVRCREPEVRVVYQHLNHSEGTGMLCIITLEWKYARKKQQQTHSESIAKSVSTHAQLPHYFC